MSARERRRVVHAVAGHRDDVAHPLSDRQAGPCPPAPRARSTPMLVDRRASSASSSPRARRRVSARPCDAELLAIAAAVTAWSPVIICTRIPAPAGAIAIADLRPAAAGRRCRRAPGTSGPQQREQIGGRIEAAGSKSCARSRSRAVPGSASRAFSSMYALRNASSTARSRGSASRPRGAGEQLVRRTLDEAADDVAATLVAHPVERRHQLEAESNGSSATRG